MSSNFQGAVAATERSLNDESAGLQEREELLRDREQI
jgi:hypothetical protein